jgi:hypothetical protein
VDDPSVAREIASAFDAAGVRYDWRVDPATGEWQVVIHADDLQEASTALDGAGLEFTTYGEPIGLDGEPWQPEAGATVGAEQPEIDIRTMGSPMAEPVGSPDGDVIDADWRVIEPAEPLALPAPMDDDGAMIINAGGEGE